MKSSLGLKKFVLQQEGKPIYDNLFNFRESLDNYIEPTVLVLMNLTAEFKKEMSVTSCKIWTFNF